MSYHGDTDAHFRDFGKSLKSALEKYGNLTEKEILGRQKKQFERLIKLEDQFRTELAQHVNGVGVYRDFVHHVCEERRNILSARPFFRERQEVFTSKISDLLKNRNSEGIKPFRINWTFVSYVMRVRRWGRSKLVKTAREIENLRNEMCETNLPLAISRATIFWRRTNQVHLEFMDLVQICVEGLLAAIDKFCLPFTPVWRSVAIGRMVGNMIEVGSDTFLHFFPGDRRKIYRAHKIMGRRFADVDFEALATQVNLSAEGDLTRQTNADELSGLMAAVSMISTSFTVSGSHTSKGAFLEDGSAENGATGPHNIALSLATDESCQADHLLEDVQMWDLIKDEINDEGLRVLKTMQLHGIDFNQKGGK